MKADKSWKGKSVKKFTNEYINGKKIRIKQPFRWYDSPKESFYDRNKFLLENKRYKHHGVFKADNPIEQAEALERAGYATEPNYAKKISEDIYKYGLDELDKNIKI
jgi:flagellum-specific peptidoglycan hydrolase FlgJ